MYSLIWIVNSYFTECGQNFGDVRMWRGWWWVQGPQSDAYENQANTHRFTMAPGLTQIFQHMWYSTSYIIKSKTASYSSVNPEHPYSGLPKSLNQVEICSRAFSLKRCWRMGEFSFICHRGFCISLALQHSLVETHQMILPRGTA